MWKFARIYGCPFRPAPTGGLAGATVLANLSASNITVGKTDYRRLICASQSAKCISAYLYSAAGYGESHNGHGLGRVRHDLREQCPCWLKQSGSRRKSRSFLGTLIWRRLLQDRMRTTSFQDTALDHCVRVSKMRRIPFAFKFPEGSVPLMRNVSRFPYVPGESFARDDRCYEVYNIQVQGLMKRNVGRRRQEACHRCFRGS